MKVLELLWGGLIVVGFLLTGAYMAGVIDPNSELSLERMSLRANHIYLLMSGLVVIAWSQRSAPSSVAFCRWGTGVAGVLICAAPILLAIAFSKDGGVIESERLWTYYGVIVLFAGVVLSFLVTLVETLIARYSR